MINTKTLLTAATLAVAMAAGAGAANADPWDHHDAVIRHDDSVIRHDDRVIRHDEMVRQDMHRRIVDREHVFATLRVHHYRWLGDPAFVRGHYVVRVAGHYGRPVFVEIDPYTGAFIGEFRI